jgi:hypothetical protein
MNLRRIFDLYSASTIFLISPFISLIPKGFDMIRIVIPAYFFKNPLSGVVARVEFRASQYTAFLILSQAKQ